MIPILCGVDRTDRAHGIVRVAAVLAHRLDTGLVLLHAAGWPPVDVQTRRIPMGVEHAASRHRRELEAWLGELAREAGAPRADVRVELGMPAEWLVATAAAEEAALVVVGSRTHEGWRALALGSVATAVTQRAPCPVVVVPPAATDGGDVLAGEQVACGIGGPEDAPAARLAATFASALGAGLTLVHVLPPRAGVPDGPVPDDPAALALLSDVAAEVACGQRTVRLRLRRGDPGRELAALTADEAVALVVVRCRGRGPLLAGLLGSTAHRLTRAAARPVAICPPGVRTPAAVPLPPIRRSPGPRTRPAHRGPRAVRDGC